MEREFLEGLGLEPQAIEAVLEAHGKVVQTHSRQLAALQLEHQVSEAVHKAGGRNVKAISALLDLETIASSEDVGAALEEAICGLKKESGYLFHSAVPVYARFTGAQEAPAKPATLAGALRERMKRK